MKKHRSATIKQQVYKTLQSKLNIGASRHEAKNNGTSKDMIASYETYKTYKKQAYAFANWMKENHPEVTKLSQCKKYYKDYLESNKARGLSAWTLNTQNQALIKVLGIKDKDRWTPPKRERADIKRSRLPVKDDKHFSEEKNAELVNFLKSTGLRRHEALNLKSNYLVTRAQLETLKTNKQMVADALETDNTFTHFVYVKRGKGGKERLVPVLPHQVELVKERFEKAKRSKDGKVWNHISKHCDVHSYRSDYAAEIYRHYARDTKTLKKGEKYCCRKDQRGRVLDKVAMKFCTKALGHNRLYEVAKSYSHKF